MTSLSVSKAALTPEQVEIVTSTLPVVAANIEKITPNFYARMFAAHPELIADTFNRGNQKQGAQQKALAASVATFAATLVDSDAPAPEELLSRIGHKHISVGIVAEQYPIVHKHLFDAIEEILTPEVFQGAVREAWDAVYIEMERVLIAFERGLYDNLGVEPGDVFRAAHVVARTERSGDVAVFTVELDQPTDVVFKPGQYISVRQEMPDGARQLRQYSLVGAGDGKLTFAVRRVDAAAGLPAGEVSTQLWQKVRVGDAIEVSLPAGDLVIDTDADSPVVMVSAGIGETPMIGMLDALAAADSSREVVVFHTDRSEESDALRVERESAVSALPNAREKVWYAPEKMDLSALQLPADAEFYLCGGTGFLQSVRGQLEERGVDRSRIHFELFSPNDWLLDA